MPNTNNQALTKTVTALRIAVITVLLSLFGAACRLLAPAKVDDGGAYAEAVRADRPFAYWRMTREERNTTLVGMAVRKSSRLGGPNSALCLNGVDACAQMRNEQHFDFLTDVSASFTIDFWARMSVSEVASLLSKHQQDRHLADGVSLTFRPSGETTGYLTFGRFRTVGERSNFTTFMVKGKDAAINDGKWHHLALVSDAGRISMYVDGVPKIVNRRDHNGGLPDEIACDNDFPLLIGAAHCKKDGRRNFFRGLIDEIAIYKRPLSAKTIASRYQQLSTGMPELEAGIVRKLSVDRVDVRIAMEPLHFTADANNFMTLHLQNGQNLPVSVTTRLTSAEKDWHLLATVDAVTLKPRETGDITFEVTIPEETPNGNYSLDLEVDVEERTERIELSVRMNTPIPCYNVMSVPTIDGDLLDWGGVPATFWRNPDGSAKAEIRSQWDEEFGLYFAVKTQQPGVLIFLAPEGSGVKTRGIAERQYRFTPGGSARESAAEAKSIQTEIWRAPEYALKQAPDGYNLEAHIPADQLPNWKPRGGKTRIGVDFQVFGPGTPVSAEYFSGAQLFDDNASEMPWLWGALQLKKGNAGGIVLYADTSKPDISTFILGESVNLTFGVSGLKPGQEGQQLELRFMDGEDRMFKQLTVEVQANVEGKWETQITAPSDKLGLYRVWVALSNGLKLPELGSRRKSYITYAVVPDPASRKLYPDSKSRFGIFGDYHSLYVYGLLGARWGNAWAADRSYPAYFWSRNEPDHPGEFRERMEALRAKKQYPKRPRQNLFMKDGKASEWRTYKLPALFHIPPKWALIPESRQPHTGALKSEAENAWRNYCLDAGKTFAEYFPDRTERLYQISWEPQGLNQKYDERLLRTYEIAYQALHEADPKAVVIGPTSSASMYSLAFEERLFGQGLGKYIDGYSTHPYLGFRKLEQTPEELGVIEACRAIKALLHKHVGRELPMYATESGRTSERNPAKEQMHAQYVVRANLILLGEGFQLNSTFFPADINNNLRNSAYGDFGLFYNLTETSFHPQKIAPKTVVPAYAAMTFLIDGHTSTGAIEGLGEKAWGYTFAGAEDIVRVLWSAEERTVAVAVEAKKVEVFDWMGNRKGGVPVKNGQLQIEIGPNPVYLKAGIGN